MSETQAAVDTGEATSVQASPLEQAIEQSQKRRSVLKDAAAKLGVPDEKRMLNLLRQHWTVSKGQKPLTDTEMFTGISLIARYDLDPISKEIYVTRNGKGQLLTMVGIDGWIKILDRTDHYDGFDQDDEFDEHGNVVKITTRIYSKSRSYPAVYPAYMKEYEKMGGFVASQAPIHMLRLFSLRHAARLFVPMGGVVSEAESQLFEHMATRGGAAEENRGESLSLTDTPEEKSPYEMISQALEAATSAKGLEQVKALLKEHGEKLSTAEEGELQERLRWKQESFSQ